MKIFTLTLTILIGALYSCNAMQPSAQDTLVLLNRSDTITKDVSQEVKKPIYFKNGNGVLKGNLNEGSIMSDLSWAWSSNNACFVEPQKKKFTGNHVLYYTDLPAYSEMEVTVVPNDPNANFSIYAYQVGTVKEGKIVPNLNSCTRCEADFKWDYKKRGKTQDHTRTVKDLLAIANPFQVVIGVVGADGLTEGDYELHIKLKTR